MEEQCEKESCETDRQEREQDRNKREVKGGCREKISHECISLTFSVNNCKSISSSASASAKVSTTSNDPLVEKHFQFLDVEGAEALKSQVGTPSEITRV